MTLTIKARLILLGTLLTFVPTAVVSIVLSYALMDEAENSLRHQAEGKLVAVRNATAKHIESYFETIEHQAATMAAEPTTIDAMKMLATAYQAYPQTLSATELAEDKTGLAGYYQSQFDNKFKSMNGGASSNPSALMAALSENAIALQHDYISANSAPLGEKDSLLRAPAENNYNRLHARFHPSFKQFQQTFGFYDVFLVDAASGDVVYTVFKELDFATSLKDGPFAKSGLAEAYRMGMTSSSAQFTDFAPYVPSYNAAAAFVSAPIVDDGKKIGVLIFQMPVDRLNAVMTHDQQWQSNGLGSSGETYLVGQDGTMRSNSRTLLENKSAFLDTLKAQGQSPSLIDSIGQNDSTMGLLKVDNPAVTAALNGQTGFTTTQGDNPQLLAYRPLKIGQQHWALISAMSQQEAFAPVALLRQHAITKTLIASAVALLVGGLLGWLVANLIVRPIHTLIYTLDNLASGEGDLSQRLNVKGKDELAQLAGKVNTFIDKLDTTFAELIGSVMRLVPISSEQADINGSLSDAIAVQKREADSVALYLERTDEASKVVDSELVAITEATSQGNKTVDDSHRVVESAADTMHQLSGSMAEMVSAIDLLKGDTDRIAKVIDVINSISEQTNLLALNAAIEAARAGEAGRGFAVVADEVRNLAAKTRESTGEVTDMVHTIQTSTMKVVRLMEEGKHNLDNSSERMSEATEQLSSVTQAMGAISQRVDNINEAIQTQQAIFSKVSGHYDEMNASFAQAQQTSELANTLGQDIRNLGDKLTALIQRFKVSEANWSTKRRSKTRASEEAERQIKDELALRRRA
ncbi:MAG: methyl-accepting chemotaxis protein [Pseudomonadota bacterium]|uniref:methyl-accepting chemotaxis protein n=1 Tax=Gallaecimonas pentaromativorans TaxID=584787 RepID=UPI00067F40F6|nr:methyl-accepting chemotaxis protein [Gallaecimonas pentaromativorans]MED5526361.1 methyl-accepting chemotaxis protein [Pseudomonadota bacterium]